MTDEFGNDELVMDDDFEFEMMDDSATDELDDEYEEISSEEVDRVLAVLEELIEDAESENVRYYLEEAADNIFSLVYEETEDGEEGEEVGSEAA
ncbi:MAG: hypothetical protein GXP27_12485 [Planctomycetes bacterium]|nr:hypothetical protein [Planctomycetota bacterium]